MNRIPSVMKTVVYLKTQGFYVNLLRHNSNKYINFYKQIITNITRYNLIVPPPIRENINPTPSPNYIENTNHKTIQTIE